MSEHLRSMSNDELGAALSALDLAWPVTPDLAPAVMASTRTAPPRVVRLPLSRPKRILLIAAAAVLLLAGAAIAARIVIDLGAVVVRVLGEPGTLPTSSPAPLGEPITLEQAADLLGAEVGVPSALGPPDRVWADEVITDAGTAVRVTIAWRPGPALPPIEGTGHGAVLMRFEGDEDLAFKEVYEETGTVEPAHVGAADAVWTTGSHLLELLTVEGVRYVRVDGNVLLWREGPFTLRLETSLTKAEAVRIAESLPGTPRATAV